MPWLSIILALLTFFMSGGAKKENRAKALASAALVGAGTYYATHETDWANKTLGELDGVVSAPTSSTPLLNPDGTPVLIDAEEVKVPSVVNPSGSSVTNGLWETLKSWGAAGTAAVVGVGTGAISGNSLLLIGGLALAALLLLK